MLLSKQCLAMGLWALYSFLSLSERHDIGVVIHDDGSLDNESAEELNRLFPGCRIIRRAEADRNMKDFFAAKGLRRCERLRDGLIFALKLFDVCVLKHCDSVILLDCDVLFFKKPEILLNGPDPARNLFMRDLNPDYCYSIPDSRLDALAGNAVSRNLNPGIMKISGDALDFDRIERCLEDRAFWDKNGSPHYYAELTLWAMELSHASHGYLGPEYGFVYSEPGQRLAACHYCGTFRIKTVHYGEGLLRLKDTLGLPA